MFNKLKSFYDFFTNSPKLSPEQKMLLKLRELNDFESFITYFKSHKIDPNFEAQNSLSLLMICVNPTLPNSEKYAEFLLNSGADINQQDKSGRSAFLMVCHWEETELIDLFLQYKPDLDLSTFTEKDNVFPTNPVVSCLWKENYELAEKLFRKGACPFKAEQILKKYTKIPEKTHRVLSFQKRWKNGKKPILLAREAQKKYIEACKISKKPLKKTVILAKLPSIYFKYIVDYIV